MISPNVTVDSAAIDKDVMSGTDEQGSSASFLASLLSLISSLNPINTLGVQDGVETSSSEISQSPPNFIDQSLKGIILPVSIKGETTFSEKPGSLYNSASSPNYKPLGKSTVFSDIQTPIGMIEKEIAEFSSLNTLQSHNSEEKESPHPLTDETVALPPEFPVRKAKIANLPQLHQFTSSPMKTSALMEKDINESKQEEKGLMTDDNFTLPLAGNRDSSLVFEEGNRDDPGTFHVNKESDLYKFFKTLKEGFEGEFKITKTEIATEHTNENSAHPKQDVHDSSFVFRQINLSSTTDNKPLQDKQSLEPSKVIISHLDIEQSHTPDLSTIKVTVQHDGLGELDIKLILNNGVINGQIKTPEVTTADLIVRSIPEIMNSLIRDGLNVGNFFVSLRNGREGREALDYRTGDGEDNLGRQTSGLRSISSNPGYINIFV